MKIISHEDQINAGCFDVALGIDATEFALNAFHNGDVIYPDKTSQILNEEEQTRINCLPATIRSKGVCGMKWVAVFPPNPLRYGVPNLNASILLSEITTGYPIAFMDGTLCSDLRTAAISAVAAKYLAKQNSETIGFIGSGEQAKMHLIALARVLPNLKVCKVSSRNPQSEDIFIKQMSRLLPEMRFIACVGDYEKSAIDSDVVVTAISAQLPLLKAEWLKDGVYYNHVGGWEDDYNVPMIMDKIVCDDWNAVKHRTQTISRLYKMGKLHDEDIYGDLHEIVAGEKRGRESDIEKIYFNPVGLSYVDVALGKAFFDRVLSHDINVPELDFRKSSVFDEIPQNIKL